MAPDHSTLSRFRTAMTQAGVYQKVFDLINKQLEDHRIILKKGLIVDASVVETPLRPKGKTKHQVAPEEGQDQKVKKSYPSSVDSDATWLKKRGKYHFGYKKHHITDEEGMIRGVCTTTASVNEITNLEDVLNTIEITQGIPLSADKGYQSQRNNNILRQRKLKNRILKKAKPGQPLTEREKQFNKLVGKTRFKVERSFGSIKRWFSGGVARYRGIEKMHTQNLMEALAYNLYRSPGIIASRA